MNKNLQILKLFFHWIDLLSKKGLSDILCLPIPIYINFPSPPPPPPPKKIALTNSCYAIYFYQRISSPDTSDTTRINYVVIYAHQRLFKLLIFFLRWNALLLYQPHLYITRNKAFRIFITSVMSFYSFITLTEMNWWSLIIKSI